MVGLLSLLALLVLLLLLLLRWRRVRGYWADRGVPFSPPHPLLGSLTFLQQKNIVDYLREEYDKFSSAPYFGIWLLWRPCLVIKSPEIARNILVKDFNCFRDRFIHSGRRDPIGRLNMFSAPDPLWSSVRRRLTAVFTSSKLKSLHHLKLVKSKELVQRIEMERRKGGFIDIRDLLTNYTTDIIGASAFGVEGDATLTDKSPMRGITQDFMTYSFWRGLAFSSIFFVPEASDIFGFTMFPKSSIAYFRRVYRQVVEERRGKEESRDLMDALLKMKREAQAEGEEMDDDVLVAQAAIFLQGGFDTTAVALTYAIYQLAYSPHVQQRLFEEVSAAHQKLNGEDFDYQTLSNITYLQCVIKETLRLHTAMGYLDRIAGEDYRIDDHLTIKKGTPVWVCAGGMHYDPHFFPDPETFDPARFLPENEKNIKPFTYMPFGEGPRNCIGLRFGRHTMWYALAYLVLAFQFHPLPNMPLPKDVKIHKRGIFLAPEITLSVEFKPRVQSK